MRPPAPRPPCPRRGAPTPPQPPSRRLARRSPLPRPPLLPGNASDRTPRHAQSARHRPAAWPAPEQRKTPQRFSATPNLPNADSENAQQIEFLAQRGSNRLPPLRQSASSRLPLSAGGEGAGVRFGGAGGRGRPPQTRVFSAQFNQTIKPCRMAQPGRRPAAPSQFLVPRSQFPRRP